MVESADVTGHCRVKSYTGFLTADGLVPLSPSYPKVTRAVDKDQLTFWVNVEERNGSQMARVTGLSSGLDDTIKNLVHGACSLDVGSISYALLFNSSCCEGLFWSNIN